MTENEGDVVDLFAIGPKDTILYESITLPYEIKVKHNNLPLRVSVKSDKNYYEDFTIGAIERGDLARTLGLAFGYSTIGSAAIVGGALAASDCFDGVTAAVTGSYMAIGGGLLALGYTARTNTPKDKSYLLASEAYNETNSYKKSSWWLQMNNISDIYALLNDKEYKLAEAKSRYMITKEPTAELYYLKGVSNYYLGEYKQSLNDLWTGYYMIEDKSNPGLKSEITDFIDIVNNKRSAIKQERAQLWSEIALGTLQVASQTYAQAVQYENWQQMGITPSGVITDPTKLSQTQLDALANPMFAAHQVNQAYWQRYTEFCRYNKKPDGSNYTYQEWCAIEGQMIQNAKDQGYDIIAENQKILDQQKADFKEQRQKDKEDWFARYGYDVSSSSTNSESNTVSTQQAKTSTTKSNVEEDVVGLNNLENNNNKLEEKNIDAKQQFKRGGVSSDDYHYEKKVTLYKRDGSSARAMFTNKDLCVKNAIYYVKIDNMYYKVIYSNWNRFNRQIVYGHDALYFDM